MHSAWRLKNGVQIIVIRTIGRNERSAYGHQDDDCQKDNARRQAKAETRTALSLGLIWVCCGMLSTLHCLHTHSDASVLGSTTTETRSTSVLMTMKTAEISTTAAMMTG